MLLCKKNFARSHDGRPYSRGLAGSYTTSRDTIGPFDSVANRRLGARKSPPATPVLDSGRQGGGGWPLGHADLLC